MTPSPPLIGSSQANDQLWHIPFNRLENLNEQLVKGREDVYFGAKLQGLPDDVIKYYVDMLRSDPNACAAASASTARSRAPSRRTNSERITG